MLEKLKYTLPVIVALAGPAQAEAGDHVLLENPEGKFTFVLGDNGNGVYPRGLLDKVAGVFCDWEETQTVDSLQRLVSFSISKRFECRAAQDIPREWAAEGDKAIDVGPAFERTAFRSMDPGKPLTEIFTATGIGSSYVLSRQQYSNGVIIGMFEMEPRPGIEIDGKAAASKITVGTYLSPIMGTR